MRTAFGALLLLALAAPLAAQRPAGPPAAPRRAQLEAQLLQRFAAQAGREMRLDSAGQLRLSRILREVASERRDLNAAAVNLRQRIATAVRDPAAPDSHFEQLLREQRALRQREEQLWEREQARLEQVLNPRQRVHFSLLWLRLQDDARGLMMQRGLGPRAGGGPPTL